MELYDAMKKITNAGGILLYTDTDSVVYAHEEGQDPLDHGPFELLGDLKDEHPDKTINEFLSTGPKQYGTKMTDNESGAIETSLKIRGITLDVKNREHLPYDTFKETVELLGCVNEKTVDLHYDRFRHRNNFDIHTVAKIKKFRGVCSKVVIF